LHSAWRHEIAFDWKSVLVHEQVRLVLLHVSAAHEETGKRTHGDPHSVVLAAAVRQFRTQGETTAVALA
jgi:hypothetical protein